MNLRFRPYEEKRRSGLEARAAKVDSLKPLSFTDPTVRACVDLYVYDDVPLEKVLLACVKALAESNASLREKIVDAAARDPRRLYVQLADAPGVPFGGLKSGAIQRESGEDR